MRCLRRVCPSNIPLVQYFRRKLKSTPSPWKKNVPLKRRPALKRAGRDWSARNKPVRNAISRLPCSLRRKIRMPLTQPARVREKKATAAQTVVIAPGENRTTAKRLRPAKRGKPKHARVRRRKRKTPNRKPTSTRVKRWKRLLPGKSPQSRSADSGG